MTLANFFCNPQTKAFNSDGRSPIGYTHLIVTSGAFTIRVPGKYRIVAIGGGGGANFGGVGQRWGCGAAAGCAIAIRNYNNGDALNIGIGSGGGITNITPPLGGTAYANFGGTTSVTGPGISLIANGGQGGIVVDSTAPNGFYPGGVGGTATGGDFNYQGGNGGGITKTNDASDDSGTAVAGPGALANPFITPDGGQGKAGGDATEGKIGGPASLNFDGRSNLLPNAENLIANMYSDSAYTHYDYAGLYTIQAAPFIIGQSTALATAFGESPAFVQLLNGADYTTYKIVGGARIAGQPFLARHNSNVGRYFANTYGAGGIFYSGFPGFTLNGVSAGPGAVFLTYLEG